MLETTLIHLIRNNNGRLETLMADQVRVIVGTKGYGGKIEPGQSINDNISDELDKESGGMIVLPENIKLIGVVDFYNDKIDKTVPFGSPSVRMHCVVAHVFGGTPTDTSEMKNPTWYPIDNLPFEKMILGDDLFLPYLLREQPFTGWIRRLVEEDEKGNKHFIEILGSHFVAA